MSWIFTPAGPGCGFSDLLATVERVGTRSSNFLEVAPLSASEDQGPVLWVKRFFPSHARCLLRHTSTRYHEQTRIRRKPSTVCLTLRAFFRSFVPNFAARRLRDSRGHTRACLRSVFGVGDGVHRRLWLRENAKAIPRCVLSRFLRVLVAWISGRRSAGPAPCGRGRSGAFCQ